MQRLREEVEQIQDPELKRKAQRLLGVQNRTLRGYVSRADNTGKVGWVREEQATGYGPMGQTKLRQPSKNIQVDPNFMAVDEIKKRTDRERAESLARRFWETCRDNPGMAPLVLQSLHEEGWKQGRPVSYEDLKDAAIKMLKKAAVEAQKTRG